ncbi:ABC transporter permease [Actinorhabdospora filicis]|uniref:ABC transporter permease n=1 Tax=Actinorhabdospora filicis TaxID=1785913 RepID=A0A9W6SSA8_9ACTN|nr:FtsX-like permease family protein [Actinorhabdospora filicis]GLZ79841.1 ABC transporter permease [Actinorhabdospora filicis]
MLKLTLRTALSHVPRQALAALAVVVGVAFIAGTFIFTDGAKDAMRAQASDLYRGTDAGVYTEDHDGFGDAALAKLRKVPGVTAVEGALFASGSVLPSPAEPTRRPPMGWIAAMPQNPVFTPYDLVEGRTPGPGEAVLDAETYTDYGFELGDPVGADGDGATRSFTLVGVIDVSKTRVAGRSVIGVAPADALALNGDTGFRQLRVAAPGVDEATLVAALTKAAGPGGSVLGHDEIVELELADAYRDVDMIEKGLLLFVLVAILAAGFVIANTYTIVMAQRARQIALLRLIGASRAQTFASVLAEAAVIGAAAAFVGLGAGIGIAALLSLVMGNLGLGFGSAFVIEPRTLGVAFATGVLVTVVSALLPAWRGTRVPPVVALSATATETIRPVGRVRVLTGLVLLAASAGAFLLPASVPQVGFIGITGFFGLVALGPAIVPALARIVGRPLHGLGGWAKLAVSYTARNRRRVAATTTTLILCVSLVSSVMIGAASISAALDREAEKNFPADVTVQGQDVPDALVARLRDSGRFTLVHAARTGEIGGLRVVGTDPGLLEKSEPGLGLAPGKAVVSKGVGKKAGEKLVLAGHAFTVAGVSGMPGELVLVTAPDAAALMPDAPVTELSLVGGDAEFVREAVADYPGLTVMDVDAFKEARTAGLDRLLASVMALLALAVFIALVGIANTLTLSVAERGREHGVLRALGVSRAGMRAMLSVEALLVAIVGVALGLGLGLAVSAATVRLLGEVSDAGLVAPWGRLAALVGAMSVAALLASVLPASRATRKPIVTALSGE